jgi:hypothetical protein
MWRGSTVGIQRSRGDWRGWWNGRGQKTGRPSTIWRNSLRSCYCNNRIGEVFTRGETEGSNGTGSEEDVYWRSKGRATLKRRAGWGALVVPTLLCAACASPCFTLFHVVVCLATSGSRRVVAGGMGTRLRLQPYTLERGLVPPAFVVVYVERVFILIGSVFSKDGGLR